MLFEHEIERKIIGSLKQTSYSGHITSEAWKYNWMNGLRIEVSEYLGPKPGDRILDVGCGDGWFSIQNALKHPDLKFVGVDLYEADEADEISKLVEVGNCEFHDLDALNMVIDKKFDHVVIFMALGNICENESDTSKLLENCCNTMREGSKLLVVEPFEDDFPMEVREKLKRLYEHYKEVGLSEGEEKETILNRVAVMNSLNDIGFLVEQFKSKVFNWHLNRDEVKNYFGFKCLPFEIPDKFWVHDIPKQLSIIIATKFSRARDLHEMLVTIRIIGLSTLPNGCST